MATRKNKNLQKPAWQVRGKAKRKATSRPPTLAIEARLASLLERLTTRDEATELTIKNLATLVRDVHLSIIAMNTTLSEQLTVSGLDSVREELQQSQAALAGALADLEVARSDLSQRTREVSDAHARIGELEKQLKQARVEAFQ